MTVAFFLGSKGQLLGFCLIALVYYNYNVGPVRWWVLAMAGAFALGSISLLQILQGTAENLTATILYADYFHNTSAFLLRVDEFGGFQWGGVLLSSLWSYVPRSLYAEKPYEYGQVLINRILFPGAAEGGSTPGLLLWAGDYLDFGLAGVLIGGLLRGLWFGWIHNYYLLGKPNVIGFVLLLQLGDFVRVFAYIPTPAFLLVAVPLFVCFLALSRDIFGVPARRLAPVGSVKHSRGG